jgi:hypothetical protein
MYIKFASILYFLVFNQLYIVSWLYPFICKVHVWEQKMTEMSGKLIYHLLYKLFQFIFCACHWHLDVWGVLGYRSGDKWSEAKERRPLKEVQVDFMSLRLIIELKHRLICMYVHLAAIRMPHIRIQLMLFFL